MSDQPVVPDVADRPPDDAAPPQVDPGFLSALSGTMATTPMKVRNIGFMLERLGRDCSPLQFVRELTQNAIEANVEAIDAGLAKTGEVTWDVDWKYFDETGVYKVCCIDTGIGMSGEEMVSYINQLSSSARIQSHQGNFGVGAKIAAATRNPAGVVYLSWKDGRGWMIHLWRDPSTGEYGLRHWPRPDGTFGPYVELAADAKPEEIGDHGTKVVLLGQEPDDDTMKLPKGAEAPENRWLPYYLNTRYYEIPAGITIRAREDWTQVPSGGGKNTRRRVIGQAEYLNQRAVNAGTVELGGARARWWVLDEEKGNWQATLLHTSGHAALLYRNELYETVAGRGAYFRLQQFGVIFGQGRVVIYVEPDEDSMQVETTTARTHLIINGDSAPWHQWASDFRDRMPQAIKDMMEQVAAKATGSDHTESIRDRLSQIKDLFKLSRYKPMATGDLIIDPSSTTPGGRAAPNQIARRTSNGRGGAHGGGTSGNIYALHQAEAGTPASEVLNFPDPKRDWISVLDGTRESGDLEDRAARYLMDQNFLLINADFRVFTDLIRRWNKFYGDAPGAAAIIRETVREWFEQALVETVLGVLSLKEGREWRPDQIEAALSEEALTAAVMQRYHIEMNVKRSLGTKLGSLRDKTAAG